MDEAWWNRLMDYIRGNKVIPVIGPRLLVGPNGQSSLQAQFAAQLLKDCGEDVGKEPLPPFRELNEAVLRLRGNVKCKDVDYAVDHAIKAVIEADDFVMPKPISQLAQIADFRLFVTLTPDDLLARSLGQHCHVNEIIHSPDLATQPDEDKLDLPSNWEHTGEVYLLYLFGKSRLESMSFAMHDEDILEYAHHFINKGGQIHKRFLDQLNAQNLLMIGCNFPEWLSRFILRATVSKRLSDNYTREWLVEPLKPEESFTCFLKSLKSYGEKTEVITDIAPVEFVAELHRRWMAEHGASEQEAARATDDNVPRGTMFFISYSRKTDLPRAEALYQALLRLGVAEHEVWFDHKTIEPGQDYQHRILDGIRNCRHFLPLLSQAADKRKDGFVFDEWDEANKCLPGKNYDFFLIPVIVDAEYEPECYTAIPTREWVSRKLDYAHAPEGQPDGRLEKTLKALVRNIRREGTPS